MKEFDLEKAKAGAKVCTRDGREARIVCYDKKGENPIVALLPQENGEELACSYCSNGQYYGSGVRTNSDLMLAGEKKEGWINIYKGGFCGVICTTKEEALEKRDIINCIDTTHIEWEE